jgi:serine/threonine-protein kinase
MHRQVAVTRAMEVPTTAGTTFDRELRTALWRRGRIALGFGIALSLVIILLAHTVLQLPPPLESPLAGLYPAAWWLYPLAFGLAAMFLWKDRWTARQLQLIVLGALAFIAVLDASFAATLMPGKEHYFDAAILLFLPAAIIPWRLSYQVTLGAVVIAAYPALVLVAKRLVPEVGAFWDAQGGDALRHALVDQPIAVAVLAWVSVFITHTLYAMRRELHAASRVGNYLIEGELGKGGMGKVYRAEHAMIRRPTAVKVMEADPARRPEAVARFEREVQLSATLSHPNTITIFDFGQTADATFYYAMEYLDGVDLQRMVEKHGPMEPSRAAYILRQVCGSLGEAHARDIIHRDIKPSNIFLTERGGLYDFVKVLDFGLAKHLQPASGSPELTQAGSIFGTPLYMAPETAAEEKVDHRADIYSVGCVAYWMVAGTPPFTGSSPLDVIAKHLKVDPVPPSRVAEVAVSKSLDTIILKCLAKRPGGRYRDMLTLGAALEDWAAAQPWTQTRARDWWGLHMGADVPAGPAPESVITQSDSAPSGHD